MSTAKNEPASRPHSEVQVRRPNRGAEQRRTDILAAASKLFLERGYGGVSLEMIVAAAGGSYRDFYTVFGSKDALFEHVLKQLCEDILAPLREALKQPGLDVMSSADALTKLGESALETLLAPNALAFHRLMISEAPRVPEIARHFFRSGPDKANELLASFLLRCSEREHLAISDPHAAAAVFLDGLINNLQLRALTGGRVSKSEARKRVGQVVQLFLKGALNRDRRTLEPEQQGGMELSGCQ